MMSTVIMALKIFHLTEANFNAVITTIRGKNYHYLTISNTFPTLLGEEGPQIYKDKKITSASEK